MVFNLDLCNQGHNRMAITFHHHWRIQVALWPPLPMDPNSLIFMQFSTKKFTLEVGAPPQQNPGSATDHIHAVILTITLKCIWPLQQNLKGQWI